MRIALVALCTVGAWYCMAWLTPMIYSMSFNVPGVEISSNLFQYGCVAMIALLAWTKTD